MTDFEERDLTEGLNGFLGFRLIDWREGFAQIAVDISDKHRNRQGGIHGGVTASLIDAATGFCGVYEPDPDKRRGNVTVSLNDGLDGRGRRLEVCAGYAFGLVGQSAGRTQKTGQVGHPVFPLWRLVAH